MKICSKCKILKDDNNFFKDKVRIDGLTCWCKDCCSKRANKHYDNNSEKYKKYSKQRYENNPAKVLAINKSWDNNNKGKRVAISSKYRYTKLNATPKWLTKDQLKQIEIAYIFSNLITSFIGIKCHVDHIVPLQGETYSGLHVPWNLQVTTAKFNTSKGNRLIHVSKEREQD